MNRVVLTEYGRSQPVQLGRDDIAQLRRIAPQLGIEPTDDGRGYVLTAGSHVGVVILRQLEIEIRPKVPLDRLFFLLSYAMDPSTWRSEPVTFDKDIAVLEAVVPAFARLVSRATYRGLLHGYVSRDEAEMVFRGRMRVSDQIRQRAGVLLPVELSYEDYTPDILENRILLAAIDVLSRLPLRSVDSIRALREIRAAFSGVSLLEFTTNQLPTVAFTRLNEHYKPAVELALTILAGSSLELGMGKTTGTALLFDMNDVFERFIHRGIQEELGLNDYSFPRGKWVLSLDDRKRIHLKPDLSWLSEQGVGFVGDVKYKRIKVSGILHPDLYQLLAYTVAANLPCGLLIYAQGEEEPVTHRVPMAGKTLHITAVDLRGTPDDLIKELRRLAVLVRHLISCRNNSGGSNLTSVPY